MFGAFVAGRDRTSTIGEDRERIRRRDTSPSIEGMAGIAEYRAEYDALVAEHLALNLTRGKPSPEQLALSDPLLSLPGDRFTDAAGVDLRNYGGAEGLPGLRSLFAGVLRVPADELLALGNSSLQLMYDVITFALLFGVPGEDTPWRQIDDLAVLCPVPGYDRHFAICEALGIRMIPVPMTEEGPDTAVVAEKLRTEPGVRAMFCVPMHTNPTGTIYSERVARELVSLPAAPGFRIIWDNAYVVHHLTDDVPPTIDVLGLAASAGNPDRPLVFASTSKITHPGSGVAFAGGSPANIAWLLKRRSVQTIGPDKINQQRHLLFLKDAAGLAAHMRAQRALIAPKFQAVDEIFTKRFVVSGLESWTKPKGGYFVSLTVRKGCAARAIALAGQAGIKVTAAGSPFPYHHDPDDANIRIAPTFPSLSDLRRALDGLCTCVLLAENE
jgi:DNA-binding transcriptional MocR family regulator